MRNVYLLEVETTFKRFTSFYKDVNYFVHMWKTAIRTGQYVDGNHNSELHVDMELVRKPQGETIHNSAGFYFYKRNLRRPREGESLDEWASNPESCFTQQKQKDG